MTSAISWKKLLNTLQIKADYSLKPAGLAWRSNSFFICSTVAVALFTDMFLYGLIVPVLPFMLRDRVGVPHEQIQSYTSSLLAVYAIASVVCSPLAGVLADKVATRQAPFLLGLAALLASTVMLFLGATIPILVLARILQGISGGFVWTIGLALCLETVGPENLGRTIGSIFSFTAVGNLAAPTLGGVLYEKTGMQGVFGVGAGILVIDFFMRVLVIERKEALKYEVDVPSTAGDLTATTTDSEGGSLQQTDGPADEDTQSEQASGSAEASEEDPLLGGKSPDYEYYKLRPREEYSWLVRHAPIIPCLSDPTLLTALGIALVQALLFGSFDATIPIVAGELFGFTSLKAGLLFLPLGISDLILGPIFGWCVDRYGTKPVAVLAYAFLVPVHVLLRIPQPGGADQIAIYSVLLGLCGMGMAAIGGPSIVEAGAVVQKYYKVNPDFFGGSGPYAQLYGLNTMVFGLGLAVGPELAGELKQIIGYGNMNLVLAVVCLILSGFSYLFIGGRPKILRCISTKMFTPGKRV